jgi:hypothetical protein
MANTHSPISGRANIRFFMYSFKVFNKFDALIAHPHYFSQCLDPNQNPMIDATMAISSELNTVFIAVAKSTPELIAQIRPTHQ